MLSSLIQETNLNGPVPAGLLEKSSLYLFAVVGETMAEKFMARLAMKGASGFVG